MLLKLGVTIEIFGRFGMTAAIAAGADEGQVIPRGKSAARRPWRFFFAFEFKAPIFLTSK
jgi:hypothetical protein